MYVKQTGLTLVEILLALVVNVVILLGLISVFSANVGHFNQTSNIDALSEQLETAIQLMATDIRRAGYWGNAQSDVGTGVNNNPFMAAGTDVTITGSCILFSYDYDNNGSMPAVSSASDDERYGFRLSGQTLQTRPSGASFACDAAASAWENVTDPGIVQITALTFGITSTSVPVGATSNRIVLRSIDITITGRLTSDTTVTKTLTQHVRIMNDKYVP